MKSSALPRRVTSKNPVVILRHVIKAISEEPRRYNQGEVVVRYSKDELEESLRLRDYAPRCGTVACVGGWVNVLTGVRPFEEDDLGIAAKRLHLTDAEADEFFQGCPPGVRLRSSVTARQHAADGIKHIKRFVLKKWGQKL